MDKNLIGTVYFIGAGPGDPGLITVRGQELIAQADVVLYAGSLISDEIVKYAPAGASLYNSAGMGLEQQIALMVEAVQQGKRVARLHTGDPSIFGAIREQISALAAAGVPYRIIPGVSSAFAAAAALGLEYTLPETTQTVILTRQSGRTPTPAAENLRSLATHRSSLVIFLSTGMLPEVVSELEAAGYALETPIALVYRASWPDERIVQGTLANIVDLVEKEELTHQGLIIVSPALDADTPARSHLYSGFQNRPAQRKGTGILTLTAPAARLGRKLLDGLPGAVLHLPARLSLPQDEGRENIRFFQESIRQVLQNAFMEYEFLVCIMASGIVVRELAPLLENKHSDPAVVVVDVDGRFAVSLLSGHEGGANCLAHKVASITSGQAVITTASDSKDIPALDTLAKEYNWRPYANNRLAKLMTALIDDQPVALVTDKDLLLPPKVTDFSWGARYTQWEEAVAASFSQLGVFTCRQIPQSFWQAAPNSVIYHLPLLAVGVGCNTNTSREEIIEAIQSVLNDAGLAPESVFCVATIADKAGEPGLLEACRTLEWDLRLFDRDAIRQVHHLINPSGYALKAFGVHGVCEPAALLAAETSSLLVEKQRFRNVTVAITRKEKV